MGSKIFFDYKFRLNKNSLDTLKNQDGASAILVVIVTAMLLGFTALAIDVGYMYSTRNELQNVADAAALAGAGELGRIYLTLDYPAQQIFDINNNNPSTGISYEIQIENTAKDTAFKNRAAEKSNITILSADITIGNWDFDAVSPSDPLTPNDTKPDAVRVIARRDSIINNPVSTFFGFIYSFFGGSADTFEVSAVATAALSGASIMEEGVLKTPFAISENSSCPDEIVFSPTTASCAGWHNYLDSPANANDIEAKMYGFIEDYEGGTAWLNTNANVSATAETVPSLTSGNEIIPSGGNIASLFNGFYYSNWINETTPDLTSVQNGPVTPGKTYAPFMALFDFFKFRDGDGEDIDGIVGNPLQVTTACPPSSGLPTTMFADEVWTVTVPVYKDNRIAPDCMNPVNASEIIAFANVQILMANPPPDQSITVCLSCVTVVEPGRGGGGINGNVIGDIPNLVQ